MHVERFAPSPSGRLHLGHAFSALTAWDAAQAAGGIFRLRIEDLDQSRARPEFEAGIFEDLHWLGLSWPEPPVRQSERTPTYLAALARLDAMGLIYRCTCTRRDILAAADAPQEGAGPDGPVYPGACRRTPPPPDKPAAMRLKMDLALKQDIRLDWPELGAAPHRASPDEMVSALGDIVLARKDAPASYHLAVVVDDAAEGVTHVTRGEDLAPATPIHVMLQQLLGLPTPVYRHHRLIRDDAGRRLAKRHDDLSISELRQRGWTPADIRNAVGL